MMTRKRTFNEMIEDISKEYNKTVGKELARKTYLTSEEITSELFVNALVDCREFLFSKEEDYVLTRFKFISYFYFHHIARIKALLVKEIKFGRIKCALKRRVRNSKELIKYQY